MAALCVSPPPPPVALRMDDPLPEIRIGAPRTELVALASQLEAHAAALKERLGAVEKLAVKARQLADAAKPKARGPAPHMVTTQQSVHPNLPRYSCAGALLRAVSVKLHSTAALRDLEACVASARDAGLPLPGSTLVACAVRPYWEGDDCRIVEYLGTLAPLDPMCVAETYFANFLALLVNPVSATCPPVCICGPFRRFTTLSGAVDVHRKRTMFRDVSEALVAHLSPSRSSELVLCYEEARAWSGSPFSGEERLDLAIRWVSDDEWDCMSCSMIYECFGLADVEAGKDFLAHIAGTLRNVFSPSTEQTLCSPWLCSCFFMKLRGEGENGAWSPLDDLSSSSSEEYPMDTSRSSFWHRDILEWFCWECTHCGLDPAALLVPALLEAVAAVPDCDAWGSSVLVRHRANDAVKHLPSSPRQWAAIEARWPTLLDAVLAKYLNNMRVFARLCNIPPGHFANVRDYIRTAAPHHLPRFMDLMYNQDVRCLATATKRVCKLVSCVFEPDAVAVVAYLLAPTSRICDVVRVEDTCALPHAAKVVIERTMYRGPTSDGAPAVYFAKVAAPSRVYCIATCAVLVNSLKLSIERLERLIESGTPLHHLLTTSTQFRSVVDAALCRDIASPLSDFPFVLDALQRGDDHAAAGFLVNAFSSRRPGVGTPFLPFDVACIVASYAHGPLLPSVWMVRERCHVAVAPAVAIPIHSVMDFVTIPFYLIRHKLHEEPMPVIDRAYLLDELLLHGCLV